MNHRVLQIYRKVRSYSLHLSNIPNPHQQYLGNISEVNQTYNVVGNVNEFGLCIGESTFGGLELFAKQLGAVVDYGSLIYITLQRAKTAREAISIMVALMDEYGYASEGESFSIADHLGEVLQQGRYRILKEFQVRLCHL